MLDQTKKCGTYETNNVQHTHHCHWFLEIINKSSILPLINEITIFPVTTILPITIFLLSVKNDIVASYWSSTNVSVTTITLHTILKPKCFLSTFWWYPMLESVFFPSEQVNLLVLLFFHSHIHYNARSRKRIQKLNIDHKWDIIYFNLAFIFYDVALLVIK